MHYSLGKSEADETYLYNNSQESYSRGLNQFEMYMENRFKRDMNKIKIKEFFYFVLQNMGRNKQ
jgi:hypothetical protein